MAIEVKRELKVTGLIADDGTHYDGESARVVRAMIEALDAWEQG
jgi:hypothetical protein